MAAGKPSALDERRAEFARYKEDVKKRGKPFYPFAMFEDTVMSVFVVSVIIALATIWKWTSWAPDHDGTHQGLLGPEYTAPENLERLRQRGLAGKRSLALREFALGVEALERFVRREPLYRVHECVFGVLALESQPVDSRL